MGKVLRIFAEIATIIGLVVTYLAYVDEKKDAINKLPEDLQEVVEQEVETKTTQISPQSYQGSNKPAWIMFQAAMAQPYSWSKDKSLATALSAALDEKDFELSLIIIAEMPYSASKASSLSRLADIALQSEDTRAYAVMAAQLSPYSATKSEISDKVIRAYSMNAGSDTQMAESAAPTVPDDEFDFFREVFDFAKGGHGLDMSADDANVFAENWVQERTYKEFLFFREVEIFADSRASMWQEEATQFAIRWMEERTHWDFATFTEFFEFAFGSSGLDLSAEEAIAYAEEKMMNNRLDESAN